jgi:signal transduction histidine kinase/phage shock protein PspC (stress-responsive transcriptional regulator)
VAQERTANADGRSTDPGPPARGQLPVAFLRSRTDRISTGVAGGLAERFGVDALLVRVGFVVLASAAGAGILAYVVAWVLSTEPPPDGAQPAARDVADLRRTVAFGCVLLGTLLLLRDAGIWLADGLTWPLAAAGLGSALIWTHGDERERARLARLASRLPGSALDAAPTPRVSLIRVVVGGALVAGGMAAFLAANQAFSVAALGNMLLAMTVTVIGLGLLVGPWVTRLVRQLATERRERIRSEERAEMAAHLHDSVLQTLALIQRSGEPRRMASLARGQERELRAWLFGEPADPGYLGAAVEAVAAKAESAHHVPVEVVRVGDVALDEATRAFAAACGEAISNASRHSGTETVSVYVEVEPECVTASVTDRGCGFDPGAVPDDRRGIAESIVGRLRRHGGDATVTSTPGAGTEVTLELPIRAPGPAPGERGTDRTGSPTR